MTELEKVVKPFGHSGHIIMEQKYRGMNAKVIVDEPCNSAILEERNTKSKRELDVTG